MSKCPHCGCTELAHSAARGDTVCTQCGEVVEERTLVAETSFVTGASGAKFAAGSQVLFRGAPPFGGGPGAFGGAVAATSEMSIQRGLQKLNNIAERLQLSIRIQEAGRRMFQLAAQMNFTAGRPTRFVASACLYIICRRNRSPHLLIDFSDVLRVSVKTIGRTYLRLLRRLIGGDPRDPASITDPGAAEVPIIDPSIFVERFARQLDLGNCQRRVQNTAVKLIQFMHRDWICVGRRPNGLCGAALLIASFYHGQKVDAKQISDVVRLGEDTIRQRLVEARQTPLALMSFADFEKADPQAISRDKDAPRALPPCFRERQRKEELKALEDQAVGRVQAALANAFEPKSPTSTALCLTASAPAGEAGAGADGEGKKSAAPGRAAKRRRRRVAGDEEADIFAAPAALPQVPMAGGGSTGSRDIPLLPLPPSVGEDQLDSMMEEEAAPPSVPAAGGGVGDPTPSAPLQAALRATARDPSQTDIEAAALDLAAHLRVEGILAGPGTTEGGGGYGAAAAAEQGEGKAASTSFEVAKERIDDLVAGRGEFEQLPIVASPAASGAGDNAGARSDALSVTSADVAQRREPDDDSAEEEEGLSDVDDEELEQYLLDEEERRDKATVWLEINRDYLEEWHVRGREARRRQKAAAEAAAAAAAAASSGLDVSDAGSQGSKGRRWRPKAGDAVESTALALHKKGRVHPNQINIEALQSLFDD